MKRFFISLMVALTAMAVGVTVKADNNGAQSRQVAVYGVAFYNLENLFDTIPNNPLGRDAEFTPDGARRWNGAKYWSKIDNMARAITAMTTKTTPGGPAVIGVSEIENRSVLEDLVRAVDRRLTEQGLPTWNLQIVHHDSPDARGVDVGLLYNPKLFKVINVTNHRLSIPDNPRFRTRDQMCVVGLLGGSRVGVIVNHWPSRRGGKQESSYLREAAAALSRSIADSLLKVDPNMGIIVMGDLNDDPSDRSVSQVLGAVRDVRDVQEGGFYNPFWEKLDRGIGSYVYRGQWDLFDQIVLNHNLVQGNNGLKFHDAEVLNKEFLKQQDGQYKGYPHRTFSGGAWQNGYSDHFPTEIFLIREMPAATKSN